MTHERHPLPGDGLGQAAYERVLADLRRVRPRFGAAPLTWAELPQADRDAWDRCFALAEADSAERFSAQAHAFAVTSGEQRATILALAKALVREMER